MNAIEELLSLLNSGLYSSGACDEDATYRFKKSQVMEMRKIAEKLEAEYMELPRDKNGDVIHVGDTISYVNNVFEVEGIVSRYMFTTTSGCVLYSPPCELGKTEQPDSMEQIKADAVKDLKVYWDCDGYECEDCPSRIDGETPDRHFDAFCCEDALRLDLIARTEKLLGGGE